MQGSAAAVKLGNLNLGEQPRLGEPLEAFPGWKDPRLGPRSIGVTGQLDE